MKAYAPKTKGGGTAKGGAEKQPTEAVQQGNPIMGWLSSSVDWAAGKFEEAKSSIDGWVDGVTQSAQELLEVARASSIDVNSDRIDITSDLDEILDLLPAGVQQQLQLDRDRSSNEAELSYDLKSGEITIKSPSVAIQGANIDKFSMGAGTLEGVEITIHNASGSIPVIGQFSTNESGTPSTSISIKRATANTVEIQSENGPIGAEQVELNDVRIDLSNEQKGLFSSDESKRTFSVASTNIKGLRTSEISAAELALNETHAQLSEQNASISAKQIAATQLNHANGQADSAALLGVSAHFQMDGNQTTAQLRASQSDVQGLKSNGIGSIDSAKASNVQFSNHEGMNTSADHLSLSNLDTEHIDADSAQLSDLSILRTNDGTELTLGSAEAKRLNSETYGTIDSAKLANAAISNRSGIQSSVEQLTLNQVDTDHVDAAQLSLDSFQVQKHKDGLSTSADTVSVSQLETKDANVRSASLSGINIQHSDGTTRSQLEQGSATGITGHGTTVGNVTVSEIESAHSANQDSLTADSIIISDVENNIASTDKASIEGLSYAHQNGNHSAQLTSAEVQNTRAHGLGSMENFKTSQLSGHFGQYSQSVEFDQIQGHGLRDDKTTATLGQIKIDDGKIRNGVDGTHGQLSQLSLINGQLHNNSIGRLDATGAQAQLTDQGASAAVESASFESAQVADNRLRVDSGQISQAGISTSDIHWQEALKDNRLANGTEAYLNSALFQGISSESELGKANVSSAEVQGASVQASRTDYSVSAESANLTAAHLQSSQPLLDGQGNHDSLIGSIASRVDSGQINAQMNLNEGPIGNGHLKVKDDTVLDANLAIENNQLSSGSGVQFSKPIDAPLWFTVKGASINEDGKAMADVGGWGNKNITKDINKAAGVSGNQLPNLGTLVDGFMSNDTKQSSSSEHIVDTQSIQANGHLHFSDGDVRSDNINATLSGASQGANQLTFATEAQKLTASFANFLASSLSISGPNAQINTGSTEALGGNVILDPKRGTANGSVSQINVQDIHANGKIN
ncbi:MAG: hypothetical protein VX026_02455 [Myxococcota bacterium]|nr:hypothetical protein [Myxococcota bacterium]